MHSFRRQLVKRRFLLALLAVAATLGLARASAQEIPAQATIAALLGTATVKHPDGSSRPATVGLRLSPGATILTAAGARLSLQAHEGIVAVIAGSSHVELEKLSVGADGVRHAQLHLRSGNIATSLDPAHRARNDYSVRTARGLAHARGTTMTVSVNGNVYTVSVLAGSVTVDWAGGLSVNIVGNTPADVTSNFGGQVSTVSLASALAAGGSTGLTEALTAAAAAVATVATNSGEVIALINTIATAAGASATATNTVASVTAAAVGAAVTNPALLAASGGSGLSVATTIGTAAVTASVAAGNRSAIELILVSAGNAVVESMPGASLSTVAKTLTDASNSVSGNPQVKPAEVISGVNAPLNPGTPLTPIDPTINVSPAG